MDFFGTKPARGRRAPRTTTSVVAVSRGDDVDVYRKLGLRIEDIEEEGTEDSGIKSGSLEANAEGEKEGENRCSSVRNREDGHQYRDGDEDDDDDDDDDGAHGRKKKPRVVTVLATYLEKMVARNDEYVVQEMQQAGGGRGYIRGFDQLTAFHGMKAPGIGVARYVERIYKYAHCSPSCFVVAYAYLDRFIHRHPGVPVTSLNIHRLLITSVMVAAKFLDDAYYNNAYYAKVGGVTTAEINRLELEFLFTLGFRLQVTTHIFESYCCHLEREYALGEPYAYQPILERRKLLNFSWSFGGGGGAGGNQHYHHHHHHHNRHEQNNNRQRHHHHQRNVFISDTAEEATFDRPNAARERQISRVRWDSSPYVSLQLAETVS
ncbi:hypothetical protein KP509_10G034800 [Ceratopteris richardii]|uniref:Cyclin n=1 Tax=Ceratopteris richardii TaxID=49495 RepID=A0A8T2TU97_CERRI|nr:hypothetical protein KP509_10G034800 [Ceratopteris richardii]